MWRKFALGAKHGSINRKHIRTVHIHQRRLWLTDERVTRKVAGFSIDEVSVSGEKISYNYVEALENGDFEALPGVVFVKGFVKNLIKTYGVNDFDVIEA